MRTGSRASVYHFCHIIVFWKIIVPFCKHFAYIHFIINIQSSKCFKILTQLQFGSVGGGKQQTRCGELGRDRTSQAFGRRSPSNPQPTFSLLGSTLRKSVSQIYSSANVLESAKHLALFQFLRSSVKSRQNQYPWNGKKPWLLNVLPALAVDLSSSGKLLKGSLKNSCSYSSLGFDVIPWIPQMLSLFGMYNTHK